MKRTKRTIKARVEPAGYKHLYSDPAVQEMAADALFGGRPYYKLDKQLLKQYGPILTVFLAYTHDKWKYYKMTGKLQSDGSFFLRHQDIQESTGLSEYAIKKCKKELIDMRWISTKMKGLPQKEFYYLHLDKAVQQYENEKEEQERQNLHRTNPPEITGLDPMDSPEYNNNLFNNNRSSIDNTKVLSYDPTAPTGPSDPPEPSVHPDVSKILSYWFSLPNTVQHKQSSKAYNNSIQIIDNLLNGLPIQHTKDGHPYKPLQAFCSKHRIDSELLSRKWPVNQIKKILRSIHKHMAGKTGNGVKGNIPLDMVFWNNHANNGGWSWFLFKASESSVPEQFQGMAAKLAQAIGQDLPEGKLLSWARDLQLLCNTNPADEVDEVLDWYMQNYDWQYVKSVMSCKDFCQFYKNIKKSMHSQYNDNKSKKSGNVSIGTMNMKSYEGKDVVYPSGDNHDQEGDQE